MVRPPLALVLLRASRWFDAQLLARLEERGWPRLTPPQSLVFAHLSEGGTPPSELARRLGTSRQATHELVAGMARLGLLGTVEDAGRARGRLVVLTPEGRALAADARTVLADLERTLGAERVEALHDLLADVAHPDPPGPGGGRGGPSGRG